MSWMNKDATQMMTNLTNRDTSGPRRTLHSTSYAAYTVHPPPPHLTVLPQVTESGRFDGRSQPGVR